MSFSFLRKITSLVSTVFLVVSSMSAVVASQMNRNFPVRTAKRVVSFADLHGDLDVTIEALVKAKIIDPDTHSWIVEPDTVVIQLGDIVDRGNQAREIYDLFFKLQDEAKEQGSEVILLLGNHEAARMDAHKGMQRFYAENAGAYIGMNESSWVDSPSKDDEGKAKSNQYEQWRHYENEFQMGLIAAQRKMKNKILNQMLYAGKSQTEISNGINAMIVQKGKDWAREYTRERFQKPWDLAWKPGQWLRTEIENRFRIFAVVNGVLYVHAAVVRQHVDELDVMVREDVLPVVEMMRDEKLHKMKDQKRTDHAASNLKDEKPRHYSLIKEIIQRNSIDIDVLKEDIQRLFDAQEEDLSDLFGDSDDVAVTETSEEDAVVSRSQEFPEDTNSAMVSMFEEFPEDTNSAMVSMSEDLRDLAFALYFQKVTEELRLVAIPGRENEYTRGLEVDAGGNVISRIIRPRTHVNIKTAPFWSRDVVPSKRSLPNDSKACRESDKVFEYLNVPVKTMVVGHTITKNSLISNFYEIKSMCYGKIILTDTAMSLGYTIPYRNFAKGEMSGLEMASEGESLETTVETKALIAFYADAKENRKMKDIKVAIQRTATETPTIAAMPTSSTVGETTIGDTTTETKIRYGTLMSTERKPEEKAMFIKERTKKRNREEAFGDTPVQEATEKHEDNQVVQSADVTQNSHFLRRE